jgi:phosphate-selective porin OprO/OprP
MKKSTWLCSMAIVASISPTVARAEAGSEASEIAALRREMRELAEKNQKEIYDLKRQLQELRAARPQLREPKRETARARAPARQAVVAPQAASPAAAPGTAAAPPSAPATGRPGPTTATPPTTADAGAPQIIVGVPSSRTPPLPSAGVHVLEAGPSRFGIESADGRNAIFLTGRLHFDVGDYLDYKPASKFASVQDLNSGVNARRARLGVVGRFMSDWNYTFIYDVGGSTDGYPPTTGALPSGLENALLTYNGFMNHGVPLTFDLGYMDVPFGQAESTSSNDIPLVERAEISNVATNIFANDFRSAVGARSYDDHYWTGLYLTGPTSGTSHTTGEQVGIAGRAGYNLWKSPEGFLHLEGSAGALLKPPTPGGIHSITLSDRPELRVDPTSILNTGAIGTAANPLTNAQVYGIGGVFEWHNFMVDGEYYLVDVNRQGLATNNFDGGYIEGSWVITGERRAYSPPSGGYLRPVPEHVFMLGDGGCCGAFELAARYSTINLNDHYVPVPSSGSNSVGGGLETVYSVGLNWYPNANIRFMFDYLHGDLSKRFSTAAGGGIANTPPGTPVGGNFDAVVMRTQVAF